MKSSWTIQRPLHCAAVLTLLRAPQLRTMRYLEEARHRALIQEPRALGSLPGSSGSWGAFPPPQTLISIWQFVVAFCCSPASVCFTILLQRRLPNMLAHRGFLFSCLGPTSVMWTGRL